jgi:glycosyltransferase involved in cell wall biosynthesis
MQQTRARGNNWLGLNWQINPNTGWGILGLNLAVQAELDQRMVPVPLVPTVGVEWLQPEHQALLKPVLAREKTACGMLEKQAQKRCHCDFPVVHSLGNWLGFEGLNALTERVTGSVNLGIIFFENTQLSSNAVTASKEYQLILAGSSWNCQVLRKNGIEHVETFLQGIDPTLFRPARPAFTTGQPFLIYSGGKLEYRKGQDITVAAFRKFRQRHSDAILVTTWHNSWPKTIAGIERRGHVTGRPQVDAQGHLDVTTWLEGNGVPRQAIHDVGLVPNHLMPSVYNQVSVAVLPNRCEGGTNLVAMECLACGVPTILSANTGHLDLVDERHCYPLVKQSPVQPFPPFNGTEGWGESDVDEVVEMLERVYQNRAEAERRGAAAVRFMQDWSWKKRFEELLRHLEKLGVHMG